MTATLESTPHVAAIRQRQRQGCETGDFAVVAARVVLVAERLCDTADLHPGWRVLDATAGSGDGAFVSAAQGCTATRVDDLPELLERARRGAATDGLPVRLLENDAEALFPDESFDAVTSVFGATFAPDHVRAARELARACGAAGRLALASWTPDGFVGELFHTASAHVPPPPGVTSPTLWGTTPHLRALLGEGARSVEVAERTFTFRFASPQDFASFFRRWYGPGATSLGGDALEADLAALARRFDRLGRTATAIPALYTEAFAVRR